MTIENPNFTIITNGGCAAKCDFCTDSYTRKSSPNYLANLAQVLYGNVLPSNFVQCSISGGEPTTSPYLQEILSMVKQCGKFKKVVFTTNGARLKEHAPFIAQHINHLNVSRHAVGDVANERVFNTKHFIKDDELKTVAEFFNVRGVDINLNHVYTKNNMLSKQYVLEYVEYAKQLGANSVSFRYDQNENSLAPTPLEEEFSDYVIVNKGGCPVCRNHTILIRGMPVVFKASFAEPSKALNNVYELIYGIEGKLTTDWEGKHVYKRNPAIESLIQKSRKQKTTPKPDKNKTVVIEHVYSGGGGCGRSGYHGCGTSGYGGGCGGGGCGG